MMKYSRVICLVTALALVSQCLSARGDSQSTRSRQAVRFFRDSPAIEAAPESSAGTDSPAIEAAPESSAGTDSLAVEAAFESSVGTNGALKPLWSYSQQWGRYTQYSQAEALLYARAEYLWHNRKNTLAFNAGLGLEASTDRGRTMLHEAFIGGRIWKIDFILGRQAKTPLNQHGDLGLGTYLMSDNARPVTRVGAGFFSWWSIPGIRDWVQLKGGLYMGKMPNEDGEGFAKDVLLHEKFLYVRLGHMKVKPYVGLVHSVMMGGTLADTTINHGKVPVDFWASFFGRGSRKLMEAGFEGEYYNAAGGHQGMWDVGLDMNFDDFDASLYYQRPFHDVTAKDLGDFVKCRDYLLGFDIALRHTRAIRRLNFEYLTTLWQGGNGPLDPAFVSTGPKRTGEVVWLPIKAVTVETLHDYFSQDMISQWESEHGPLTQNDVSDFLVEYANGGWQWGNRSQYLSHPDMYKQGWTVSGLSMGYPVFLTNTTMRAIAQGYDFPQRFSCLRMTALNFGISGEIMPKLSYKAKFTYTDNYGHYREEYYEGADFAKKRPNYYFENSKTQIYTGLWLNYRLNSFTLCGSFSADFGQMYQSFSLRLGVRWSLGMKPSLSRRTSLR